MVAAVGINLTKAENLQRRISTSNNLDEHSWIETTTTIESSNSKHFRSNWFSKLKLFTKLAMLNATKIRFVSNCSCKPGWISGLYLIKICNHQESNWILYKNNTKFKPPNSILQGYTNKYFLLYIMNIKISVLAVSPLCHAECVVYKVEGNLSAALIFPQRQNAFGIAWDRKLFV